jgi:hypothetical protein
LSAEKLKWFSVTGRCKEIIPVFFFGNSKTFLYQAQNEMIVLNLLRDDDKVALKIHWQIKKVREKEINEEKVGQSYRARLLRDDYKVALKIPSQIKKVREKEIHEEKVGQSYRARLSSILSFWVNFCLEQLV